MATGDAAARDPTAAGDIVGTRQVWHSGAEQWAAKPRRNGSRVRKRGWLLLNRRKATGVFGSVG